MALASPDHDSPTSLPGSKVLLLFYLVNMRNPINPNCGTVQKWLQMSTPGGGMFQTEGNQRGLGPNAAHDLGLDPSAHP